MGFESLSWDKYSFADVAEDESGMLSDSGSSHGDGRCSSKSLFASMRHQRWAHRSFAALVDGAPVEFSSWRELADLEGKGFEGSVVSGSRGNFDLSASEYMDSSTVRGGFPLDCPSFLRHRLGRFTARLGELYDSEEGARELKVALALRLRELGYPELDDAGLLSLARELFPLLAEVPVGRLRSGSLYDFSPKALSTRALPASERAFAASFMRPDRRELFLTIAGKYPTFASWGPDGRLSEVQVVKPSGEFDGHSAFRFSSSWASDFSAQAYKSVVSSWWAEKEKVDGFCFTCHESPCGCAPQDRFKYEVLAHCGSTRSSYVARDHTWGSSFSVRVNSAMHAAALERVPDVVGVLEAASESAGVDVSSLGPALGYNVALFLETVSKDEVFLKEVAASLLQELAAAEARARSSHAFYARTLFEEFESPSSSLSSVPRTEVYLGRDGIYAYQARLEQLRVLREGLSAAERQARRERENDVRFVTASRLAFWSSEHNSLLGDGSKPPVFVDTGFAGTIPERIMAQRGEISSRARFFGSVAKPKDKVRLFSTSVPEYGFSTLRSRQEILAVEYDAKAVRSSRVVNGGQPTSALEQLVFRQVVDAVRRFAREETLALLGDRDS